MRARAIRVDGMKQTQLPDLVPDESQPPMALDEFTRRIGVDPSTIYRWRRQGLLKTINIYGRVYVPFKALVDFNRRAAAGEFAKEHKTPLRRAAA